jgi:hypothetical protein
MAITSRTKIFVTAGPLPNNLGIANMTANGYDPTERNQLAIHYNSKAGQLTLNPQNNTYGTSNLLGGGYSFDPMADYMNAGGWDGSHMNPIQPMGVNTNPNSAVLGAGGSTFGSDNLQIGIPSVSTGDLGSGGVGGTIQCPYGFYQYNNVCVPGVTLDPTNPANLLGLNVGSTSYQFAKGVILQVVPPVKTQAGQLFQVVTQIQNVGHQAGKFFTKVSVPQLGIAEVQSNSIYLAPAQKGVLYQSLQMPATVNQAAIYTVQSDLYKSNIDSPGAPDEKQDSNQANLPNPSTTYGLPPPIPPIPNFPTSQVPNAPMPFGGMPMPPPPPPYGYPGFMARANFGDAIEDQENEMDASQFRYGWPYKRLHEHDHEGDPSLPDFLTPTEAYDEFFLPEVSTDPSSQYYYQPDDIDYHYQVPENQPHNNMNFSYAGREGHFHGGGGGGNHFHPHPVRPIHRIHTIGRKRVRHIYLPPEPILPYPYPNPYLYPTVEDDDDDLLLQLGLLPQLTPQYPLYYNGIPASYGLEYDEFGRPIKRHHSRQIHYGGHIGHHDGGDGGHEHQGHGHGGGGEHHHGGGFGGGGEGQGQGQEGGEHEHGSHANLGILDSIFGGGHRHHHRHIRHHHPHYVTPVELYERYDPDAYLLPPPPVVPYALPPVPLNPAPINYNTAYQGDPNYNPTPPAMPIQGQYAYPYAYGYGFNATEEEEEEDFNSGSGSSFAGFIEDDFGGLDPSTNNIVEQSNVNDDGGGNISQMKHFSRNLRLVNPNMGMIQGFGGIPIQIPGMGMNPMMMTDMGDDGEEEYDDDGLGVGIGPRGIGVGMDGGFLNNLYGPHGFMQQIMDFAHRNGIDVNQGGDPNQAMDMLDRMRGSHGGGGDSGDSGGGGGFGGGGHGGHGGGGGDSGGDSGDSGSDGGGDSGGGFGGGGHGGHGGGGGGDSGDGGDSGGDSGDSGDSGGGGGGHGGHGGGGGGDSGDGGDSGGDSGDSGDSGGGGGGGKGGHGKGGGHGHSGKGGHGKGKKGGHHGGHGHGGHSSHGHGGHHGGHHGGGGHHSHYASPLSSGFLGFTDNNNHVSSIQHHHNSRQHVGPTDHGHTHEAHMNAGQGPTFGILNNHTRGNDHHAFGHGIGGGGTGGIGHGHHNERGWDDGHGHHYDWDAKHNRFRYYDHDQGRWLYHYLYPNPYGYASYPIIDEDPYGFISPGGAFTRGAVAQIIISPPTPGHMYAPGEPISVSAAGFQPGEPVVIQLYVINTMMGISRFTQRIGSSTTTVGFNGLTLPKNIIIPALPGRHLAIVAIGTLSGIRKTKKITVI